MDIGDSFQRTVDKIFEFLPNLVGFLLVLLIGYIVAKVVATVVRKALEKVGVDRRLQESSSSRYVDAVLPGASPSAGVAKIAFWLIFLLFAFTAVGILRIPVITDFMNRVLSYLPNVIVAILIFVVAALLSGAVAGAVGKFMGDTPTGKIVAGVAPALIMVIAMFMILEQLQIAPEIVRIAFAAVMFALALGLALAFGLGGRGVASRLLEDAYQKSGDVKAQARQDMAQGRDRAQESFEQSDLSGSDAHRVTGVGATASDTRHDDRGATRTWSTTEAPGPYDEPGDRRY